MKIMKVKQQDGTIVRIPLGVGGGTSEEIEQLINSTKEELSAAMATKDTVKKLIVGASVVEVSTPVEVQENLEYLKKYNMDLKTISFHSKNLFNLSDLSSQIEINNGIITLESDDYSIYLLELTEIREGETYTLSYKNLDNSEVTFYLQDGFSGETTEWKSNTPIIGKKYNELRVKAPSGARISEIQVEYGNRVTPYTEYKENIGDITATLYDPTDKYNTPTVIIDSTKPWEIKWSDGTPCTYDVAVPSGVVMYQEYAIFPGVKDNISKITEINNAVSALETYVYDNDDQVLGLEVDFINNKFTRLCGAKGLLHGEDFNRYRMYGQRRRCNVDDEGNILNFYGDDTPTYYRLKLYEGTLPTSIKETTITTPLYYIMRQQSMSVMPIPGVGAFFVGFDGKEPTMVTLKPGEKTSVSDGVSATAGGSYDSTNNISYYDGTFTLTTEGSFPNNVKVIVVFQSGYSEDGFHGQVMVYQPKFYYKVFPVKMNEADSSIADVVRYYVSDKQRPEFKLHPAFYDKNGNEVDYILLSAYEAGLWSNNCGPIMDAIDWIGIDTNGILDTDYDTLLSIANTQPISGESRSLSKTNCELLAQNRGENWHIENIKTLSANQLLMIIEYGQMNMQEAISVGPTKLFGYANRNGSLMTGSTASLGNSTGSAVQSARIDPGTSSYETFSLPGDVSISYRGLENPWGNIYKFVDGIYYNNADVYICSKLNDSEYINTGLTVPGLGGYISKFKYSKEYDWLFIPAEANGTDNLPVGDQVASGTWGIQTFLIGGTYYTDRGNSDYPDGFNTCGLFKSWVTLDDGTMRSSDIGARLIYVPTADVEEV